MLQVKVDFDLSSVKVKTREGARRGLKLAAEEVLARANETVPHDEGTLEASGEASVAGQGLIAVVSYDTPYAVRLHEHPEYDFQQGRRGKWLEATLNESHDDILKWLQKELSF